MFTPLINRATLHLGFGLNTIADLFNLRSLKIKSLERPSSSNIVIVPKVQNTNNACNELTLLYRTTTHIQYLNSRYVNNLLNNDTHSIPQYRATHIQYRRVHTEIDRKRHSQCHTQKQSMTPSYQQPHYCNKHATLITAGTATHIRLVSVLTQRVHTNNQCHPYKCIRMRSFQQQSMPPSYQQVQPLTHNTDTSTFNCNSPCAQTINATLIPAGTAIDT